VLERPRPETPPEAEAGAPTPAEPKGRGGRPAKPPAAARAKKATGRTVYVPDDLWERVIVQAHRRRMTYSDYVCLLLDRHVPDHRVVRSGAAATAEPAEDAA
jgi:hypothetical protein